MGIGAFLGVNIFECTYLKIFKLGADNFFAWFPDVMYVLVWEILVVEWFESDCSGICGFFHIIIICDILFFPGEIAGEVLFLIDGYVIEGVCRFLNDYIGCIGWAFGWVDHFCFDEVFII